MKRNSMLLLLFIFLILVAAACGCHIWRNLHVREKEQQVFEKLEKTVALPEQTAQPVEEPVEELKESQVPVSHDHDCDILAANNVDCIGWLSIPDTIMSYPVMYSPADPERYLHLDYYGRYSYSGTPFLDARCDPNKGNLIIYGHNMINGTMFGSLSQFLRQTYLLEHRQITLELLDGVHNYEIIAVATVEQNDPWYYFLHAKDAVETAEMAASIRSRSQISIGDLPMNGERLLTLSTCTGIRRSERLILVAKEV